jgi:hypothetical protein
MHDLSKESFVFILYFSVLITPSLFNSRNFSNLKTITFPVISIRVTRTAFYLLSIFNAYFKEQTRNSLDAVCY